jgi:hypothetical protein
VIFNNFKLLERNISKLLANLIIIIKDYPQEYDTLFPKPSMNVVKFSCSFDDLL